MKRLILLGCATALLTSCAPFGAVYHNVQAPPENVPLTPVNGKRVMTKTGESCAYGVLGLVAWGDASQDAAARAGGITQVQAADEKRMGVLGIVYRKYCTVVSGV